MSELKDIETSPLNPAPFTISIVGTYMLESVVVFKFLPGIVHVSARNSTCRVYSRLSDTVADFDPAPDTGPSGADGGNNLITNLIFVAKEPTLNFSEQNMIDQQQQKTTKFMRYSKKVIKPTPAEIQIHKTFLKNELKANK